MGMLGTSSRAREAAAEQALGRHGHERVLLDATEDDLRGVDAMWVAERGEVDWTGENRLFPLMSVAVSRGMPLLASGAGVRGLVEVGLLPGQVIGGAGGTRQMRIVSRNSAWTGAVEVGAEMSVPVDEQSAEWVIDSEDLTGRWHPLARWVDFGGTAAVATSNGNVVGLLGAIDVADDVVAHTWLARPTAMLAGSPLVVEDDA